MSTDRSRLVSSIRRIVLTDPDLSSALDAWQNRGDQASSTGTGTSDAERDRLCCDGSTSSNPNPGADTRDTSEGGQDGLNADDPALLDSGPGSLTGVTDCATGEPICFDGSDWLPPEGWGGPNQQPSHEASSSLPTCSSLGGVGESAWYDEDGRVYQIYERCGPDGEVTYDQTEWEGVTNCINLPDCEAFFPSLARTLDTFSEAPIDESATWPSDGCTNLAIKNGSIVGSKFDPENDGSYSKPMSEIELCDGSGNSFLLRPSASGGWKTIKSLDGEPDGAVQNGWLYSAYGDVIQQITPSEFSDPKV